MTTAPCPCWAAVAAQATCADLGNPGASRCTCGYEYEKSLSACLAAATATCDMSDSLAIMSSLAALCSRPCTCESFASTAVSCVTSTLTDVFNVFLSDCLCDASKSSRYLHSLASCMSGLPSCYPDTVISSIMDRRDEVVRYCPGFTTPPCTCEAAAATKIGCEGMADTQCVCGAERQTAYVAAMSLCVTRSRFCHPTQLDVALASWVVMCGDWKPMGHQLDIIAIGFIGGFAVLVMGVSFIFHHRRWGRQMTTA